MALRFLSHLVNGCILQKSYVQRNPLKYLAENSMQDANKLTVLVNPKLTEAAVVIEKAFVQRRTLVVAGK